jgi:oxygen-independent coproporphyrinogen-3 oxidase
MFVERFRSHHDAEEQLHRLLNPDQPGGRRGSRAGGDSAPDHGEELEARLRDGGAPGQNAVAGIYIHVPYCDRICSFCNLNRREAKGYDPEAYTAGLIAEIEAWGRYPYVRNRSFSAVYLGGGTPTVLGTRRLQTVLGALKDNLPLAQDCEITIETTQHNLDPEKAAILEKAGANRISLGLQTISGRGRTILGRTFPEERAREHLRSLRENFTGILGIDIIYSYPGQTREELLADAELCAASGIDSVSFYSLMIHEGSSLARSIAEKKILLDRTLEGEQELHRLFYCGLGDAGFDLLELTKLARPGRDHYRYIEAQYGRGDILPVGSGAGGRVAGFSVYSPAQGRRFVSPLNPDHEKYHRMLGLLEFARYDPALLCGELDAGAGEATLRCLAALAERGLLEAAENKGAYRPTAEGVFWGNNMAAEILGAAINHSSEDRGGEGGSSCSD